MARIQLITRTFTTSTLNGFKLSDDMKAILPVSIVVDGEVKGEEALEVARKHDKAVAGIASISVDIAVYGIEPNVFRENAKVLPPRTAEEEEA